MDIERKIRFAAGLAQRYHSEYLDKKHSPEQQQQLLNQLRLPSGNTLCNTLLLGWELQPKCKCYICYYSYNKAINTISLDSSIDDLSIKAVLEAIAKNKTLQNVEYYNHRIKKMLKF